MVYRRTHQVVKRLAARRSAILTAARNAAAEGGMAAVQIAPVAIRANVAAGTVYRYFPSKADLISELIADVSRDPLPTDPAGLNFYPVAKYYLCVVTTPANKLANLTQAQVEGIFTGKTTAWSQVPGATASGPIDIISRNSSAGTLSNFQTLLINGKKVSGPKGAAVAEKPSEGLQRQSIEQDPNAVGFLSGYFASKGVNPVSFNGVGCTLANATAGQYAGVARFYEVTKGGAKGAAASFISWIDTSKAAKSIISTQWIPLK